MDCEVHCVILWYCFDAEGKLINSDATELTGSMANLQERLREAHNLCAEDQKAKRPHYFAAQVIQSIAGR